MIRNEQTMFHFIGPMGVKIEVGQSLLFLVGLIIFLASGRILDGLIFVALLIAAIFLHELGHAWGCQVQGIPVRRIMLHGGGGFCERAASATPKQEELIVAMGPLVNLALWAIAGLLMHVVPVWPTSVIDDYAYGLLSLFAFLNLALFVFNLVPVQPLDGGKLLHVFLLRILSRGAAHRVAGGVGLVFAVLWIPAAIFAYVTYGWILFFLPSIPAHYRMARGELA